MSPPAPAETGALGRLAHLLTRRGGLVAAAVTAAEAQEGEASAAAAAAAAAAGPRARECPQEYELLLEAIYEGYLLHHGEPRIVRRADPDLAVLAGDQLYALGLSRLVALGDMPAVRELSDIISLSALAQGRGSPALADAVWQAGARAIGWGPAESHSQAKQMVLDGHPEALETMLTSAIFEPRNT